MTVEYESGPFAIVPLWVIEALVEKNSKALPMYAGLAKWTSGRDRSCYPSRQKLSEYLGVSRDTVDRWSADLQAIGALSVENRFSDEGDMTSNLYVIHLAPRGVGMDAATGGVTGAATGVGMDAAQTKPTTEPDPSEPSSSSVARLDLFDEFWSIYGNLAGTGKRKAIECWKAAMKRGDDPLQIIDGLEAWVDYWRTPNASKAMYAQGFLNQQKWSTPPPPPQSTFNRSEPNGAGGLRNLAARVGS